MRLSIRQAILDTLSEGRPMSGGALLKAVRAKRFQFAFLDLLLVHHRFPGELRQLMYDGRVKYIRFEGRDRKHNFKYVLASEGPKKKRPKPKN